MRELDKIFCIRDERTLRNDFTIAYNGKLYQIKAAKKSWRVENKAWLQETITKSTNNTKQVNRSKATNGEAAFSILAFPTDSLHVSIRISQLHQYKLIAH